MKNNTKLIMETWRSLSSEDREETQEYDNEKYSIITQVHRDLEEIGIGKSTKLILISLSLAIYRILKEKRKSIRNKNQRLL